MPSTCGDGREVAVPLLDQAPVRPGDPRPQAIWALALNYTLHIEETGLTTSANYPQIFLRMPICLVGHRSRSSVPDPASREAYEYEGELAVIIGKPGRHILGEALRSCRRLFLLQRRLGARISGPQPPIRLGKNFEHSGSFGPWLMTPDEFGDPADTRIITRVNGIERQNAKISGCSSTCRG